MVTSDRLHMKQKLHQKIGSFTENPYICTMNREMEYKLH